MKLQVLVPQYQEDDRVVQPLLDSIAIQQNVDFAEIGVVICNDGSDVRLSEEFLNSYPFQVEYHLEPHRGVSGTRNACLDHATADYVMFCDADDMFYNACGLYIVFREIDNGGFDSLVSAFIEETRDQATKEPVYINHDMDTTFVHGKIHRRKFLLERNIRWNETLTVHEDSYFNCLCQKLAGELKYCPTPFYLWRWRDESVCRHDPKYILKTYNNMLDSNTALVSELFRRGRREDAQFYATSMIYDAYFQMNKQEWIDQENREYRDSTELRFRDYYLKYQELFDAISQETKAQIIVGIKNRMYGEGLLMEHITFDDWITRVLSLQAA
jgi:glycosyltransferase involved in cell wall biosynthesis